MFESLAQDLAYALRAMRRTPIVSAAAIVSLALGIGANTAIFSLMDALLLRALPVRSPQELVQIGWDAPKWPDRFVASTSGRVVRMFGRNVKLPFSFETYQQIRARSRTLAAVAGRMDLFSASVVIVMNGRADAVRGNLVSGNFFDTLGVRAEAGRLFADSDDRDGANPVAVLSSSYWTRAFAADPRVIGSTALINGTSYTIVGVTEPRFTGVVVANPPDVYVPLHCHPLITARDRTEKNYLKTPSLWWVEIIGRRKPGVSEAQVRAELATLFRESLQPIGSEPVQPVEYPVLVVGSPGDIQNGIRVQFSRPLVVLMTIAGFVLLIACANVANLLLARAVARQKEMAMRQALGARPRRLFGQVIVESLLLSALGGVLGLVIANGATRALISLVSVDLDVRPDTRVLLFSLALSVAVGILFGAAPALQSSRAEVHSLLKGSSNERRRFGLGRALIMIQVAASLALLSGAGLYVRTLWNLRHVALGFNAENLLTFRLAAKNAGYDGDKLLRLVERISSAIEAMPGVRGAAYSHTPLLGQLQTSGFFELAGRTPDKSKNALILFVSPRFFETMQIPLAAGRTIRENDGANTPRVAVANEALVREYFKNASLVGQQVTYWADKYTRPMEVVGVVKDAKYTSVTTPMKPVLYLPYAQNLDMVSGVNFAVRTAGDPRAAASAVREIVHRVDPAMPVFDVSTETALRDDNLRDQRLLADLAAAFAALAVFLAAVGLYGAISYSVSRRTAEIGIRMALGADRGRVVAQVLRESFLLVGGGMAMGIALAMAAARLIASQLYGLAPRDPATLASAAVVIVAVTMVASFVPARRASRIDPMAALRHE